MASPSMPAPAHPRVIHPLCYEHHVEMNRDGDFSGGERPVYTCQQSGCGIYYGSSRGYFIGAESADEMEAYTTPQVNCPRDGFPMYLLEVQEKHPSFRLWRCPSCNMSRASGQLS